MELSKKIMHCPRCGRNAFAPVSGKQLICSSCRFTYFHNPAAAVAAVIRCQQEYLFAVRAFQPRAGYLDFPGGFVDPDESLEEALHREIKEEINLNLTTEIRYLFSYPNAYQYETVTYRTVDSFFISTLLTKPQLTAADDVSAVCWIALKDIEQEQLAFASTRKAVQALIRSSQ